MSSILRVNMTDRKATFEAVPRRYRNLGGRGLSSTIVAAEVPPTCHPLGPNNKLVIAPGIVTGTAAPTSGRLSVGGKRPPPGGINVPTVGGPAPLEPASPPVKAPGVQAQGQ